MRLKRIHLHFWGGNCSFYDFLQIFKKMTTYCTHNSRRRATCEPSRRSNTPHCPKVRQVGKSFVKIHKSAYGRKKSWNFGVASARCARQDSLFFSFKVQAHFSCSFSVWCQPVLNWPSILQLWVLWRYKGPKSTSITLETTVFKRDSTLW